MIGVHLGVLFFKCHINFTGSKYIPEYFSVLPVFIGWFTYTSRVGISTGSVSGGSGFDASAVLFSVSSLLSLILSVASVTAESIEDVRSLPTTSAASLTRFFMLVFS